MRALVVEDEPKLAAAIRRGLMDDGLVVDIAADGEEGLLMASASTYDAVVLDINLPKIDGLEVCRRLREDGNWTPIIMLTARDTIRDRIAGLDHGADDYLIKPFALGELSARLRALTRRPSGAAPTLLAVGELRLDPATREVSRAGSQIELSAKEFALLEAFMRRPGRVLDRFALLEHAWNYTYENRSNVVDVYIGYLRKKIDEPFDVTSIETVRGAGYRLRADGGGPAGGSRDG